MRKPGSSSFYPSLHFPVFIRHGLITRSHPHSYPHSSTGAESGSYFCCRASGSCRQYHFQGMEGTALGILIFHNHCAHHHHPSAFQSRHSSIILTALAGPSCYSAFLTFFSHRWRCILMVISTSIVQITHMPLLDESGQTQ